MPKLNDQGFYYGSLRGRLLGNRAREHLIFAELEKISSGESFLEVGCAQGHFEKAALHYTENVFGSDFELGHVLKASKSCRAFFSVANAERLPFKSGCFDFVLCTEVLEHVPDWKLALKELQRVSRRKILVTVPLEKGYFWRAISKVSAMRKRGHLHRLDSLDLMGEMDSGWIVAKHEIVATPSRKLNRVLGKRAGERFGLYSLVLFEKGKRP